MVEFIKTEKIGKRTWRVVRDFGPVPYGFITDGASVPRLFWWVASPCTDAFEAAVLHDYRLSINDKNADRLFLLDLIRYDVPKWRAYLLYYAVKAWSFTQGR
jgi:hypothetical protein